MHSPHTIRREGEGWTHSEVEWVVRKLILEHFAVNEFDLDDTFVELGLG